MKFKNLLLAALVISSFTSVAQDGFEDFDDIYSENTRQAVIKTSSTDAEDEYVSGEDAGTWIEEDEYYDPNYNGSKVADGNVVTTQDGNGNTFVTNNYYGNYQYSNRFNRFNSVGHDPYFNSYCGGWNTWNRPGWNVTAQG